jgi:hypothetical protein
MTTEEREKREHVGIYTVGIDHMTECPDHPTLLKFDCELNPIEMVCTSF